MPPTHSLVDPALLKKLAPVRSLSPDSFKEFASKAYVEKVPAGTVLVKAGDRDGKAIFLLKGELELEDAAGGTRVVAAGTEQTRHAVASQQPRELTVRARGACEVTRVDADALDQLLTFEQATGVEVHDLSETMEVSEAEGADWMTQLLRSRAFRSLPPASIQRLFMSFEAAPVNAGDVVISQDEEGDHYYVVCRGEFEVKRGSGLALATLRAGQSFGEEALISNDKRNATVTAKTDGLLVRLSKDDFKNLLQGTVLKSVGLDDAKSMVRGGAMLMDVRMESEHKQSCIRGSINLPLYTLRLKLGDLERDRQYVCYCETGRRSEVAAYLLTQNGLEAYVLEGGLQAISQSLRGTSTS